MNETPDKNFDCVQTMRQARDQVSAEIEGMSYEELVKWLRSHRYEDPHLQTLADKAARQADEANSPPANQ